jgi:hypothetical protein
VVTHLATLTTTDLQGDPAMARNSIAERPFYIYTLSDPRNNEVRYVGVTRDADQRLKEHLHPKKKTHCSYWVKSLLGDGIVPEMTVIESGVIGRSERERYWIKKYREGGSDLTNLTMGGDGMTSETWDAFPELKERVSAKAKMQFSDSESRKRQSSIMRKIWSNPEIRARLSESQKRRFARETPEDRAIRIARAKHVFGKPEHRIKLKKSPEFLQKHADNLKKRWESEENRMKFAEASRQFWRRPEVRAKYNATIAARRAARGND